MNIEALQPKIAEIARKYNFDFVALFGSQATGKTHPKSDIDIAVIGRQKFNVLDVIGDMYTVFQREDVEVVDLAIASPTMMRVVVEEGKPLYERHEDDFLNWKFYAIGVWLDTAWLRELRDKKLIAWAKTVA